MVQVRRNGWVWVGFVLGDHSFYEPLPIAYGEGLVEAMVEEEDGTTMGFSHRRPILVTDSLVALSLHLCPSRTLSLLSRCGYVRRGLSRCDKCPSRTLSLR